MNWIKRLFSQPEPTLPEPERGLFGLQLGCAVEVDDLDFRILGDRLQLTFPGKSQLVEAESLLELGAGSRIRRYYTSDDSFIQLSVTGAETETNLEDFKFFVYDDSLSPASNAEWDKWLDAATIGAPSYTYRGQTYQRAFNAETDGNVPPIAVSEAVSNRAGDKYSVDNFLMLFEREVADGIMEYLLITAEESAEGQTISFALGVDLSSTQLNVIS